MSLPRAETSLSKFFSSMPEARWDENPLLSEGIESFGHDSCPYYQPKSKATCRRGDEPSKGMINLAMSLPYQPFLKCERMD